MRTAGSHVASGDRRQNARADGDRHDVATEEDAHARFIGLLFLVGCAGMVLWMLAIGGYPIGARALPRFGCVRPELAAMALEFAVAGGNAETTCAS